MISIRPSTILLCVASLLAFTPAFADTDLRDRYIAASQAMGENMLTMLKACAPQLDMSDIDFEFSERMTESVSCVVETHIDRFGRDETEALVEEAEAMGQRSFSSLQEMSSIQTDYPRLSNDAMLEISQACGTIEASQDLELTQFMVDNMSSLTACFTAE